MWFRNDLSIKWRRGAQVDFDTFQGDAVGQHARRSDCLQSFAHGVVVDLFLKNTPFHFIFKMSG